MSTERVAAPARPGPDLGQFGRYTLLERLAVGGMAEVFRAKITSSHGFEKVLVIKRILPHLAADPTFVAMFIDEAKLTTQLTHQKIVQILDFGDVNGQYFIALELIDGFDALGLLRICTQKRVQIPRHLVAFITSEVLDALDYAHGARDDIEDKPLHIVHRDVSPSNVFISKRGEVKLGDFGIAHAQRRESKTKVGTFKGKYGYMSPEQVSGQPLDARSDLFSVGVVLAEMAMGRRLFTAPNDLDVLLMVRDTKLDRLDRYGADFDGTLDRIVRRALRKDPRERFQSAGEFREALGDYLVEVGRRAGPADLRAFVGDLYEASPEAGARLLQQARRGNDKAAVAAAASGRAPEPMRADRELPIALAAAAAGGSAVGPSPIVRRLTPPEIPIEAPTSPANYQALTVIGGDIWSDDGEGEHHDREQASANGFTPISAVSGVGLPGLSRPASRSGTSSNVGRFVSGAPGRPPDSAGDMSVITPMRLFCDLAVGGESGLLCFEARGAVKEVFLIGGAPESVSSNLPSERFGEYLVAKGVLSAGDLDLALSMLPHYSGKLGDTLVGLGFLRPLDVFRLLSLQVRHRVIDVFGWPGGTFAFYRGVTNPNESFPLGLDTFEILGASVTGMPRELLDRRFAASLDCHPAMTARRHVEPEAFRIGPTPREVLGMLDGKHSLRTWMGGFGDEGELLTFLRSLYLLVETDLAQLD